MRRVEFARCPWAVPRGAADAVGVSEGARCQKGGGPGPGGGDAGCYRAWLYGAEGGVEFFGCGGVGCVAVLEVGEGGPGGGLNARDERYMEGLESGVLKNRKRT
jgi:hypothetical protein